MTAKIIPFPKTKATEMVDEMIAIESGECLQHYIEQEKQKMLKNSPYQTLDDLWNEIIDELDLDVTPEERQALIDEFNRL